jgi:hypothetical protein
MENTKNNNIEITKDLFIQYLHNAFCNGLKYFSSYGLEFDFKYEDYAIAKNEIKKVKRQHKDLSVVCYEDVFIKMLELKLPINVIDTECNEYNITLDLDEMMNNFKLVPIDIIAYFVNEDDDAEICDTFLQILMFKEIVFA